MFGYFAPMDPNDLLCMGCKWQRGDVGRNAGGDFFPASDCVRECRMVPGAELRVLDSIDGHLALCGTDPAFLGQLDRHLKERLAAG